MGDSWVIPSVTSLTEHSVPVVFAPVGPGRAGRGGALGGGSWAGGPNPIAGGTVGVPSP